MRVCLRYRGGEARTCNRGDFGFFAQGVLTEEPRGTNGFGYDPIFLVPGTWPNVRRTYEPEEKNHFSHRGKAFRSMLGVLAAR